MTVFLIVIWLKACVLGINYTLEYYIEVRNVMDVILIRGLSEKYPGILNISRTGRVALM